MYQYSRKALNRVEFMWASGKTPLIVCLSTSWIQKRTPKQQGFSAQLCTVLTVIYAAGTSIARYPFAILSTLVKAQPARCGIFNLCFCTLYTYIVFFSAHYRQNFVNNLWIAVNILWTYLQGWLTVGYVAQLLASHVYSGYTRCNVR